MMVQPRIGDNETVGMMVRMKPGLRDRIRAAAEQNGRSQNSEIVATLEEKYPAPSFDAAAALADYMHLAQMVFLGDASNEERAKALAEMNEIERRYKDATGEDI